MFMCLSEISPSDKPLLASQATNLRRCTAFHGIAFSLAISVALSLLFPVRSHGDVYRFVTVDGVETFTDAPVNKQARVIIRERTRKEGEKTRGEKRHDISLDEVMAKTVQAAVNPRQQSFGTTEPRLPLTGGVITSGVGMRIDPIDGTPRLHNGIDIAVREGTPVTAIAPGMVIYSGMRSGYGNTVLVEHDNGLVTLYAHNSRLLVSNGQLVDNSTVIAHSGNTGRSTGPHLHFEAWQAGVNMTPVFMPNSGKRLPLASGRTEIRFHREIMADGSILFTNIHSPVR
ncbi:peptidase M23B [Pelobacter propionicus DSM 2379]|uniref:Peptidase M23B n=2 Tax=Pelobacter propionicus TaxID=29543 RepID=A1APM2_PELPD|nr:peptidase M23B [Pelobacter propionicus DSM 2379]